MRTAIHRRTRRLLSRMVIVPSLVVAPSFVAVSPNRAGAPPRLVAVRVAKTAVNPVAARACTTAIAPVAPLSDVPSAFVPSGGEPFDVRSTAIGNWSFVSSSSAATHSFIKVFTDTAGAPSFVRSIPVPLHSLGETITNNGKLLVVAQGSGAVVLNIARAESGAPDPILGELTGGAGSGSDGWSTAVTPDEKYVFVDYPERGIGVFDLSRAIAEGFSAADYLGMEPVRAEDMAISTDGETLYAVGGKTLTVVSLHRVVSSSAHRAGGPSARTTAPFPVVSSVATGCAMQQIVVSKNDTTIWMTSSGSDEVLGYSADALPANPTHALLAAVPVGELPTGLVLFDHDERLAVTDSNAEVFEPQTQAVPAGAAANIVIINTAAALAHRSAVIGSVPTGLSPRAIAVISAGTALLVSNAKSHQLESIDVRSLLG